MNKVNILLADDHPAVRYGIKSIFDMENKVNVCAEAENGEEILEQVKSQPVDLILMDVNMPTMNGIETTRKIHKDYPNVKVLAFSMYDDQFKIMNMLKVGADGYLLKSADKSEIMEAIETVMRGERYLTKEIADKVLYQIVTGETANGDDESSKTGVLSKREEEILKLMASDHSYLEIAQKLGISKRTVDTHRYNISKKLGIKSMAGLIRYAINHNLV